jgi:hypothetical protein
VVLTIVINLVLAVGVLVMVITPLAWAILTQQRDGPTPVAARNPAEQPPDPRPGEPNRRGSQRAYEPVVGRT